jgi:hypothetical protein
MRRFFELSHHRRANVWLDEAPPAEFTASSFVTRMVAPKVVVEAARTVVGVELSIPHGPRASYGLLGAELVEADMDGLEVVVSVNNVGFPFQGSVALKPDDVKVGLLDEYANAVVTGVAKVGELRGVPTRASLRFRWAAHGVVGSSPSTFEKVSGLVVQLLTLPKDASDEQVRALLG